MRHFLDAALCAAQLKRTPRTGWQQRGAPLGGQAESVAEHCYGVVFLTMYLLDLDERDLDHELALRLAILHDFAESLVGDLPNTINRYLSPGVKHRAERAALEEIVEELPVAEQYLDVWEQYEAGESPEAKVVKDADLLDMMIQAYFYEQAGQRNLDEFWQNVTSARFHTPCARALYMELMARREALYEHEP
ncbi:MAG: HD family hydrolase [Chloroflexota bacterium]|nr:HD family hydrolase [Chloroflexota bacterium]